MLIELNARLKEKIFISEPDVYAQYVAISLLHCCVTANPQASRIFLKPTYISEANQYESSEVLTIHLSAMFWTNWDGGSFVRKVAKNSYRVCYATHNSLSELSDFLLFLKPKQVHLNVLPINPIEKSEMLEQLASIQNKYLKDSTTLGYPDRSHKKGLFKRLRSAVNMQESS